MAETPNDNDLTIRQFQQLIEQQFGHKDHARGAEGTFLWFAEEVGELASALRDPENEDLEGEFADVLAWLATLANVAKIDLSKVVQKKYATGCPRCHLMQCCCNTKR